MLTAIIITMIITIMMSTIVIAIMITISIAMIIAITIAIIIIAITISIITEAADLSNQTSRRLQPQRRNLQAPMAGLSAAEWLNRIDTLHNDIARCKTALTEAQTSLKHAKKEYALAVGAGMECG